MKKNVGLKLAELIEFATSWNWNWIYNNM